MSSFASGSAPVTVDNWTGAAYVAPSTGKYMDVTSPVDGGVIGKVAVSGAADVEAAVVAAEAAYPAWSGRTNKSRAAVMFKFHELLNAHADEIAKLVTAESGKNHGEALASIAKGNETVEYACSLPQLVQGKIDMVSRGVMCQDMREPVGVVACVVPVNFPILVPMWTVPIALTMGNCVILKPSEKVPLAMHRVARLLQEAGVPEGVFQMVQGTREVVESICDHPKIPAVSFVGSSPVAKAVYERCRSHHKKVIALGGAKNHLVALPDCDAESAAHDIVSSFAGAAGQRCMAASVLVLVGDSGANGDGGGGVSE
jgi:malonate-semialdehyde dehydrogenase (acetylating)/methylmalonate-semialdehyde dehydrogenase